MGDATITHWGLDGRVSATDSAFRRACALSCLLLIVAIVLAYGQVCSHDFVQYDDDEYIFANTQVSRGFTAQSLSDAFTAYTGGNWHPLTVLSHTLDCEIFGLRPGTHLAVNVALHAANAVLLFLLLVRVTGKLWASVAVAVLFALHPLNVESVAWASQRKSVLSGLFFFLTMHAYVWHTRRPSAFRLGATTVCFALGLLCKPMLVTLPFALLLLDIWPLQRIRLAALAQTWRRPFVEKLPLLVLSVLSSLVTLRAQSVMGALMSRSRVPFGLRATNALVSYGWYLWKALWPSSLGVFYPLPGRAPWAWGLVALVVLGSLFWVGWRWRCRRPYLLIGLLWYTGMLVPVLGLVQVGGQARADRYAYLPLIGLFAGGVWLAADALRPWLTLYRGRALALGSFVLVGLGVLCQRQVALWHDGVVLFRHSLSACGESGVLHNNLGNTLSLAGRHMEAVEHYRAALRLNDNDAFAWNNLGNSLAALGRLDEAIPPFERALEYFGRNPQTEANLGSALIRTGRLAEGVRYLEQAAARSPLRAVSYSELGDAHAQLGDLDAAVASYQRALSADPALQVARYRLARSYFVKGEKAAANAQAERLLPRHRDRAPACCTLGLTLAEDGLHEPALTYLNEALASLPDFVPALDAVARLRATCPDPEHRDAVEALEKATRAVRLENERNPFSLDTLAAAYAEAGRFDQAAATAQRALTLFSEGNAPEDWLAGCRQRLALYQAGRPYRDTSGASPAAETGSGRP